MNKGDVEKFGEIIFAIAEIKGKTLSKPAISLYFEALKQYPIGEIKDAATRIIQTHKYATIPSPADFIEFIDPPESMAVKTAEAFQIAMDTITIRGIYETVKFDDLAISHAIHAMGGWIEFCNKSRTPDDRDFEFFKKEFNSLYTGYHKRRVLSSPPELTGIIDRDNKALGYDKKQIENKKPKELEE